jgi:hypothetical protein
MKQLFGALILVCGLAAAQANAACDYPVAPGKFPDGTQASKDEMLAAKKLVVKYDADMTAYLNCIQSEFQTKVALMDKDKVTPEQKSEMTRMQDQKQNAAIDEVKSVTERFNEQLRAWKAKNVPEKKAS